MVCSCRLSLLIRLKLKGRQEDQNAYLVAKESLHTSTATNGI